MGSGVDGVFRSDDRLWVSCSSKRGALCGDGPGAPEQASKRLTRRPTATVGVMCFAAR